jgi:hypothetical protein
MARVRLGARLFWVTALLMVIGGCGFDPEGDQPMDPPPEFRVWWAKTEVCSGRTGNFDRIRWSVVEGESFPCSSGECAGHWSSNHHIFLASKWSSNEMVVRHEMLHDLLNRPGHPDPPFGQGCPLTWATWNGGAAPDVTGMSAAVMVTPIHID